MKAWLEMRLRTQKELYKRRFYQKDDESSVILAQVWKFANKGIHEIFTRKGQN